MAQSEKAEVKYLGVEDGLSNNVVNSLYQDRLGFMWMGTNDGLNRYDGYNFKIFRNQWGNDHSLIYNHITTLSGDGKDRVWIGTQKGVSYFDYADLKFYPVYAQQAKQSAKITAAVNGIAIGKSGTVFIATEEEGLYLFKDKEIPTGRVRFNGRLNYTVKAMCSDNAGLIWLFIKDQGLFKYDEHAGKFTSVNAAVSSVTSIINGAGHQLWIGTEKGLFNYDRKRSALKPADFTLRSNNITGVSLDKGKKLWISTDGGGITVYHTQSQQVQYMVAGRGDGFLSSNSIGAVFEDRESRIWIATYRGGVNILDSQARQFKTIKKDYFKQSTLVNNFVLSFCEDKEQNIWVGTDGGGLSVWNPKSNTYKNYVRNPQVPFSLKSDFVTSILKDSNHTIWVASFAGGIDRFDSNTKTFKHYVCYDPLKKTEEVNIWKLYEDTQHRLWAGSTKGGLLYKFNPDADQFEVFDRSLKNIHTIFQDSKGNLWAGNYNSLIKIDLQTKKHVFIPVHFTIRAIHEDVNQKLWIGTEGGGLLLYNRDNQQFTRFIEADGLPSNSVLNILEDDRGNLWCSTYNGLSKFNTQSGKFKNYFATDGLQSNQFNYNAAMRLSNGQLLFGGINGFNKFFPDSIKVNKRIPQLAITDFRIHDIPIEENPTYTNRASLVNINEVTIPFHAAAISVSFAAIEYSFQDQIEYAYYLEGWDTDWNYVKKLNTAYYSRLTEGSYKLHIKSTDTEGIWSNNVKVIDITVLPPWYRSWWANTSYLAMLSGIYYLFWSYRRKQRDLKYQVEIANLKMEREKELNEKKLDFFTNISHELRTPLTLIVNPIKDILSIKESGAEKNDLNVVYRNSRRLLSLVDQLLIFRKTESETEPLKTVNFNFYRFAREIFMCFSYLAKKNNIDYRFKCDDENLTIDADRDKLEIVLFNLLSNALKFTPKDGSVSLQVTSGLDFINVQVSDSGPGIPEDVGEKLFDKFYKVMNNTSLKIGFGIGLYLVKNFVEQHNGKVSYVGVPGQGTTFRIGLPKCEQYYPHNENILKDELIYVNELLVLEEPYWEDEADGVGSLELVISDVHTILVVDDNEEIVSYIKQIFKDKFKIYKAVNGFEGLKICHDVLPDIVISDVNMEEMNGIALCEALKDEPYLSHIPVILITADPSPENRLKGIEVGAYDFIAKPFDRDLFTAKINGIIKDRTQLQNYFYNEITLKCATQKISEGDRAFLQKCITNIEENLIETEFNVKTLASDLGMSHSNLYKRIKSTSNLSINSFIRFIRLRKAAELLINTNLNINEAAFRVGINDIKYFREQFNKHFKLTPSEFVKKHRKTFRKNYNVNTNV